MAIDLKLMFSGAEYRVYTGYGNLLGFYTDQAEATQAAIAAKQKAPAEYVWVEGVQTTTTAVVSV